MSGRDGFFSNEVSDPFKGEEPTESKTNDTVRARYKWKRVDAPKPWRPKDEGEELCGYYLGKTLRNGRFGQYEVALILVPARGTFMVSGTRVIQLIDAANIDVRWPIRIVWKGLIALSGDRSFKDFEVFVAQGEPLGEDDPHIEVISSSGQVPVRQ